MFFIFLNMFEYTFSVFFSHCFILPHLPLRVFFIFYGYLKDSVNKNLKRKIRIQWHKFPFQTNKLFPYCSGRKTTSASNFWNTVYAVYDVIFAYHFRVILFVDNQETWNCKTIIGKHEWSDFFWLQLAQSYFSYY